MSSELDCFDIVCIQEHWLVDRNFSSLLFSDQFMYTAVSAMDSCNQVLKGRPYGGSAIIYWANLASVISVCATRSDRLCAIILDLLCGKKLLVIFVYLPTDYGMSAGEHSFLH